MIEYQVNNRFMAVFVAVDDDEMVVDAAPLVRKFVGQPLANLLDWARRRGGPVTLHRLTQGAKRCSN